MQHLSKCNAEQTTDCLYKRTSRDFYVESVIERGEIGEAGQASGWDILEQIV